MAHMLPQDGNLDQRRLGQFRDIKRAGRTLSHQPPPWAGSHRPRVNCNLERGASREPAGNYDSRHAPRPPELTLQGWGPRYAPPPPQPQTRTPQANWLPAPAPAP
ncbi:uncharacterized protein LOC124902942 [Homo sapiens]|uniref:uncharacterized protein LOC124902942 n=1 Tax=Homo sapiens TaxID=9606 RepID=UPI0007DC5E64|nr:uncharacterized protein LOC124902942 [Homo sapiens]XP_054229933.1 uncharacterized protein LOC124902942 [Homo sapiens]|eukprot:XP_016875783.1 uncharacterized protein LOC107987175 [Homo sapiens]